MEAKNPEDYLCLKISGVPDDVRHAEISYFLKKFEAEVQSISIVNNAYYTILKTNGEKGEIVNKLNQQLFKGVKISVVAIHYEDCPNLSPEKKKEYKNSLAPMIFDDSSQPIPYNPHNYGKITQRPILFNETDQASDA